jgi:hypothetical protein
VHGSSATTQSTEGFLVERLGYYLRLKAQAPAEVWVHFAPPTVHSGDAATLVVAIRARMRTFGTALVTQVHVWDGALRLAAHDGLGLSMDQGEAQLEDATPGAGFAELRLALLAPAQVDSAVGVSMLFAARAELDAVAIAAVGVELTT